MTETKSRSKRSRVWLIPEEEFRTAALKAKTMTEFSLAIGFPRQRGRISALYGNGFTALKSRIEAMGLLEHFQKHRGRRQDNFLLPVEGHKNRANFKRRIVRDNLIPYECAGCGNAGSWEGKSLSLHLHHKNGNSIDHRLVNVCFLYPNCHSQTETYTGRNVKRPS